MIELLLVLFLDAMFFIYLVELGEQVVEPIFQSFVVLLRQRLLVYALQDLFLLVHECRQSFILTRLGKRAIVVLLCVDLTENILEYCLRLLSD
jgi:hypothetical protein